MLSILLKQCHNDVLFFIGVEKCTGFEKKILLNFYLLCKCSIIVSIDKVVILYQKLRKTLL